MKKKSKKRPLTIQDATNTISSAASLMGRKGGQARAASMTPEERSEAARAAIKVRWERYRKTKETSATD